MARLNYGVNEAICTRVSMGLTEMVRKSSIPQFRNAFVIPVDFSSPSRTWEQSTKISWREINTHDREVLDYRMPVLERNVDKEFIAKNAYGELKRYCVGQLSRLRTEGCQIKNLDDLLPLAIRLSSSPLLYSVEELRKKSILRIESPYASLDEIWQQFHVTDPFILTQLLMSRLEVKYGELGASSDSRGGYTEIGIRFYESHIPLWANELTNK